MSEQIIKTVLIIGGGPSNIGRETELDSAVYNTVIHLKKLGVTSLLLDNNAYSLSSTEIRAKNVFYRTISSQNIIDIIKSRHPDAILPVFGGFRAAHICQRLLNDGILDKYHVSVIGISHEALQIIGNPLRIHQLMHDINEPLVPSQIIHSTDEAFPVIREMGLPVIVKAVLPQEKRSHKECKDMDTLEQMLNTQMVNSKVDRCVIEKSIVGDKELSLTAIRDNQGTKIIINGIEDIDAVGIHSGDSIAISPIQTISDYQYQQLRNATFKIIEGLNLKGFCEVSFAVDPVSEEYFITKITPYYTRGMSLAELTSGYPLMEVFSNLLVKNSIDEIKISDNYHPLTPLMEPTIDRTMVRMPIWPFQDIKGLSPRLRQNMKSVGSAIGIGRTVEEALLKALRSSQFSPRDVLPNKHELTDDQLINQLIHPQANRIQVLVEALRRDYQITDLTELTKIDSFYLTKFQHLLLAEDLVLENPKSPETVAAAHRNGFGDGMLATTWQLPISTIEKFAQKADSLPTFKMLDPSAGEIIYNLNSFYSSYETENEAEPLSDNTVLVIGRGGNHLGPNTAADYYTSELLLQMKKLGFKTIIINHNPNSATLTNTVSDRRYIEPIQLGNILDIIRIEHPKYVIVPGNRHYLVREIKKSVTCPVFVLPPDQETNVKLPDKADYTLNFFVTNDEALFIDTVKINGYEHRLKFSKGLSTDCDIPQSKLKQLIEQAKPMIKNYDWRGLVQVIVSYDNDDYQLNGIRPVRIIETIFLNKTTNINWLSELVKLYTGQLDLDNLKKLLNNMKPQEADLIATYPYRKLGLKDYHPNPDYEVGGRLTYRNK